MPWAIDLNLVVNSWLKNIFQRIKYYIGEGGVAFILFWKGPLSGAKRVDFKINTTYST